MNKTTTEKVWDLFVNDLILVKGAIYDVIHVEDGIERSIVVAEAADGSLHTFTNTTYKVIVKC
jgi:hypothetical protein